MILKLKEKLKSNQVIYDSYLKYDSTKKIILSNIFSPETLSKYYYYKSNNEKLNLKNPTTFSEKIMWLKLNTYNNNDLVTQCADKYRVRDYVTECGLGHTLNELLYVWESPDEINWSKLPEKFAIKGNHGAGYNLICSDKDKLDILRAEETIQKWLDEDYWKRMAEINYKYIPKKIICESFIGADDDEDLTLPSDYKIYCFNGVPKAILYMQDRDTETYGVFMDTDWNFLSYIDKYDTSDIIPGKPETLEEMLGYAETLSEPFPFVRVDFYEHDGKVIFGELTFTPAAGLNPSETMIDGKSMGDLIELN